LATQMRNTARNSLIALRLILVCTVLLGVLYPLSVTLIAQLAFPNQAHGSLLQNASGQAVGSALLGQQFVDAEGDPLAEYFQPRPSVSDYDPRASGGSNLAPESEELVSVIQERRREIAAFNGTDMDSVPADAVTASGSGLDPDISLAYAKLQAARVAAARGMSQAEVDELIELHVSRAGVVLGGSPSVNVLKLNLALDDIHQG